MPPLPVVLVNLGTPTAADPQAVREFLAEFLADPEVVDWPRWIWNPVLERIILRSRPRRVAALYRAIWTPRGSPLAAGTHLIGRNLQEELGSGFEVMTAYRYKAASFGRILAEASRKAGPGRSFPVLPLFPQQTGSTTGTIEKAVRAARLEGGVPDIRFLAPDDPGYIESLAARCRETRESLTPPPEHLVISFHGIPVRYDRREGGRYREDCRRTARALVQALGWPETGATLTYQSRFGPEPWLTPSTAGTLKALPGKGTRRVLVAAPGFLTEGLETLEELGVRGRDLFLAAGGTVFGVAPAPAGHPALARALARLAGS